MGPGLERHVSYRHCRQGEERLHPKDLGGQPVVVDIIYNYIQSKEVGKQSSELRTNRIVRLHIALHNITIHQRRVVWDFTSHNSTSHNKNEGWWPRELRTKGDDEGWWRRVETKDGDWGKWWLREAVTKGSGDEGKWWRREVVTKGSGD